MAFILRGRGKEREREEQIIDASDDHENALDRVAFVGSTLSPFFLEDPRTGDAGEFFEAFAALDAKEAAKEWFFVDTKKAYPEIERMVCGLSDGIDDALVNEYRRLFIGPMPKPAPPWGSVYTDREGVMFGLSAIDLHRWMGEQGISRTADDNMPEDHIGLTLALMSWIALERPELLDEFLQFHLLPWSSHVLDALNDAAEHPFYRGLFRLTKLSLEGIQHERRIGRVEHPHFYR